MGLRFRKSVNFGPVRFTVSKSGISKSIGVKGLRVTKTASDRIRTTASIPGTGLSYVKESSGKKTPARGSARVHGNTSFVICLVIGGILLLAGILILFGISLTDHDNATADLVCGAVLLVCAYLLKRRNDRERQADSPAAMQPQEENNEENT